MRVEGRNFWFLLLLAPATILLVIFFVAPLLQMAANSFFGYSRTSGIVYSPTLGNYTRVLFDAYYLSIVWRTLRFSGLTAFFTLVVGYPIALYLTVASSRARRWIIFLILSPLLVSVIVRGFGWVIILGPNGLLQRLMELFGLQGVFLLNTEAAVIIATVNVLLPFAVLSITTSLQAIDPAVPRAAASLGASPIRVLIRVIMPLSSPGVLAAVMIVFGLSASTFVNPIILGGAGYKVLATAMYQQAMELQNWPFAAALAIILMIIVVVTLLVQSKALERDGGSGAQ
jgi:putative spermidine/putrescine transport system permease protein